MPDYVRLGAHEDDIALNVDFSRKRAILRANTSQVGGTELELIPPGHSGLHPAMILWKRGWKDIYFLIERQGWNEDDYFNYAEKRFKDLNLSLP